VLVMLTGFGLVSLRIGVGIEAVVWLVGVVILCDIGGYFAGRMLGGPKFWPAISPKKTWSGTAAGWICAAIWGFAFGGIGLAIVSIVIAFAGQLGDILESYLKRRAGIKDSSNLIPGHGGVLDRFDALVAAIVALMVLSMIFPLPLPVAAG
jgi:phosphatidate cytidylyltransferase